ncbi:MAG: SOS response-associated peptidase [Spirochaetia bacterium]|nr:SOS response-associated peptidase [Spirochaetia bacterium]
MQQSKSATELQNRFDAEFSIPQNYASSNYNGFQHPLTPVITNLDVHKIELYRWGLIPHWAKDDSIKKNTLNARSETLSEKPSFRSYIHQRCMVLVDGFFEWQWLDEKGKQKQKYLLALPKHEAFALAGLWSQWLNKATGETQNTYTILTMEANELLSKIHNSKKRMPMVLSPENEKEWLSGKTIQLNNDRLIAEPV